MKTPYLDKRIKYLNNKVPERFAFMKEEMQKELAEFKAIKEALSMPRVVGASCDQLKCQCKKAQFTRTVDADDNPLCGRCGKAL